MKSRAGDVSRSHARPLWGRAFTGERMQARDACVGAGSRDVSGLKHSGNGPGWARLGDGSKPEADRVITDLKIDVGSNVNVDSGGMKGGTPRYSPSLEGTGAVAGRKITGGVTLRGRALVLGLCIVGRGSMWMGTPVHLRAFTRHFGCS